MDEKRERITSKLRLAAELLAFAGIALFFVSPLAELFHRMIANALSDGLYFPDKVEGFDPNENLNDIVLYQSLISNIKDIISLAVKLIYLCIAIGVVLNIQKFKTMWKKYLKALLPLIIFGAFSLAIYVLAHIRGVTELDANGGSYKFESMYSYMAYPFVYFVLGLVLVKSKYKRVLLYIFTLSALPLHILTICDTFFFPVKYFIGCCVSGIFHNSNHYGYYIVLLVLASAGMFVYEEKKSMKALNLVVFIIEAATLVFVDTLGAFLAILTGLGVFTIYAFKAEKEKLKLVLVADIVFLVVTTLCSLKEKSLFVSFIQTFFDVGNIIENNEKADNAGSGRWAIWKGTVHYIIQKPVCGWGTEETKIRYNLNWPHNDILQYALYYGIPTAILYTSAVGTIFLRLTKQLKKIPPFARICYLATGALFVNTMVGNSMYYISPMFYCFLGLAYSGCMHEMISGQSSDKSDIAE